MPQLPTDESPHQDAIEWWYWTGRAASADGHAYGFILAFFQLAPAPDAFLRTGILAITDEQGTTYHQVETPIEPGAYAAKTDAFSLSLDAGWSATGGPLSQSVVASTTDGYSLALSFVSLKSPTYWFGDGRFDYGNTGMFDNYYSKTRLFAEGTVTVNGQESKVVGEAWHDHEWGVVDPSAVGWEWYSVQLDDGEEIGAYNIHPYGLDDVLARSGFIDTGSCHTITLGPDDFAMTATGTWTSPHTGVAYQGSSFGLTIASQNIELTLTPVVADQEFYVSPSIPPFWEGRVAVTGTKDGRPVHGTGAVELFHE